MKYEVPQIVDINTGELIPYYLVKPKQIAAFIEAQTDSEKSKILTNVNAFRKFIQKFEKVIKDWIKQNAKLEFDDKNHATFEDHRITEVFKQIFDKDRFETDGTDEEKAIRDTWETIKQKYMKNSNYLKF